MRDTLPSAPFEGERGVLNLDTSDRAGTHWTAWAVTPKTVLYFDSYGLPPPEEFVAYVRSAWCPKTKPLQFSTMPIQRSGDPPFCGHLCIEFLRSSARPFVELLLKLKNLADRLRGGEAASVRG